MRGIKEGLQALRRAGVKKVMPWSLMEWMPEPLFVYILRSLTKKESMKISGVGHALAARDEMKHLTDEFFALVKPSGTPTPILDELYRYYDPETPPLPDGSSRLPVNWTGTGVGLLVLVLIIASVFWLR